MATQARHDLNVNAQAPLKLIAAANTNDRYFLLDEPSIALPNLDNTIHTVFRQPNFGDLNPPTYHRLQPALRLASMFLESDKMLEWFVRLAFGKPLIDSVSGKTFLSEPSRCPLQKQQQISEVREALKYMRHCVRFKFVENLDCFALTQKDISKAFKHPHTCTLYTSVHPTVIQIRDKYRQFFDTEYATSNLCDKLRFDFSLATTIIHELTHAFGIMCRGDLKEPYHRLDDPQAELGWSWENFALGGIINPFDRTSARISFLMRKVWLSDKAAYAAGGKQWTAVPMAWIGQWFQKSTWAAIAESGPSVVLPPKCALKLRCTGDGYYTVYADDNAALRDVQRLRMRVTTLAQRLPTMPASAYAIMSVTAVKIVMKPTAASDVNPTSFSSSSVARVAKAVGFIDTVAIAAQGMRIPVNILKRTKEETTGDADGGFQVDASRPLWKKTRVQRV
ncbi:hypothetical protein AOQ84DRAFT_375105 [Glonium stellatum]|uniref:Uncharacterized protein n=1 Tax=Glonium stellatum TaxID=574774 RepID=A0A8E2F455_9PEZI|nr:hypothetical protein AOQ84DRAFT_375105 [Glonium stellatum]